MKTKFSVALIGGDGAGKTTIATHLEQHFQIPIKRMYMGLNTQSSNFSLPTSRIAHLVKKYSYKKNAKEAGEIPTDEIPPYYFEHRNTKRNLIWRVARFFNRLAEVWYRQIISKWYQLKGYIVVYDRHFLFEATRINDSENAKHQYLLDRIFFWILSNLHPKPDLVFLLDAPGEVLYARKMESTVEHLERRRVAYLKQGSLHQNFVIVDATQSFDRVIDEVKKQILEFDALRKKSAE